MVHTTLIHAHHRWPSAITPNLWPHELRMANDAINVTLNLKFKDAQTPIESFTGTKVASNLKHWHLFGCPAYVLVQDLQMDTAIHHKWKLCWQVSMYLGQSPQHAWDVSLVLNLEMGLVSPQFHIKLDSNFQTLREKVAHYLHPHGKSSVALFNSQPRLSNGTQSQKPDQQTECSQCSSQRECNQLHPSMMNQNWPQRPKTITMQTCNLRNYLHCEDLGASIAQLFV